MIWVVLGAVVVCVLAGIGLAFVLAMQWAGSAVLARSGVVRPAADHPDDIFFDVPLPQDQA